MGSESNSHVPFTRFMLIRAGVLNSRNAVHVSASRYQRRARLEIVILFTVEKTVYTSAHTSKGINLHTHTLLLPYTHILRMF